MIFDKLILGTDDFSSKESTYLEPYKRVDPRTNKTVEDGFNLKGG